MEELKIRIKNAIEEKFSASDFITDVVVINITKAGISKVMIGIETLTHCQESNVYDMDYYATDEDIINAIILNHLEAIGSALVELGWESAKKEYCYRC